MSAELRLSPGSAHIIKEWAKKKSKAAERVIDYWLIGMAGWMGRAAMKAFNDMKQPGGKGWAPNRGRYANWKSEQGQNKPGELSGKLKGSISHDVNKTRKEAKVGSSLKYAPYFNYGTSKGAIGIYVKAPGGATGFFNFSRGMQARPFLPDLKYTARHGVGLFNQLAKEKIA